MTPASRTPAVPAALRRHGKIRTTTMTGVLPETRVEQCGTSPLPGLLRWSQTHQTGTGHITGVSGPVKLSIARKLGHHATTGEIGGGAL
jgi:hypothetical protein